MESINVITVLLSIVGVVAVTELAMWLFVVIRRPEHFRLDLEPLAGSADQSTDKATTRDSNRPIQQFTRR